LDQRSQDVKLLGGHEPDSKKAAKEKQAETDLHPLS
jgi:hypothetical protein